ncbi:MAG: hypothetical protein HQL05_03805 [Nitrospirae bacterium]|uniref:hypothetical protein n=1 Tax=Candidatus Magnetobacterium casense TaxID=1455061 RepID=UPI0012DF9049|nr:hypothetical protein [Candidatus Magnetobacterium casensis]MBF0336934.1 hypothetical protein [Nitrospirota bacterium]
MLCNEKYFLPPPTRHHGLSLRVGGGCGIVEVWRHGYGYNGNKVFCCYVKILRNKKDDGSIERLKQEGITKNMITFDCQIVAIALTHGASYIYSHDKGLSKFAYNQIKIEELPEITPKLMLFDK